MVYFLEVEDPKSSEVAEADKNLQEQVSPCNNSLCEINRYSLFESELNHYNICMSSTLSTDIDIARNSELSKSFVEDDSQKSQDRIIFGMYCITFYMVKYKMLIL